MIETLIATAWEGFKVQFGHRSEVISVSPGRVNLIGEHTDYHDGFVFPAAIDQFVVVAASQVDQPILRIVSDGHGDTGNVPLDEITGLPKWALYGASPAILWNPPMGMEAFVVSNLPVGAGLSSSAAIEVAFARIWDSWLGHHRISSV